MEIKINNYKSIKLNEMIQYTLNTDNLANMFEFVLDNNKNALNEINDIKLRCTRIEDDQKKAEDIFFKLNTQERKINDIQSTIHSYNTKFMDMDTKISDIGKKVESIEELGKILEDNFRRFHLLEDNFNLVNKLTEENIKNIEKTSEGLNLLKDSVSIENKKNEEFKENLNKNVQVLNNKTNGYEEEIQKIEKKIIEYGDYFLDLFDKLKAKNDNENLSQKFMDNSIFDENNNPLGENNLNNYIKSLSNFSDNFQMNDSNKENKIFKDSNRDYLNKHKDDVEKSRIDIQMSYREDNSISKKNTFKLDIRSPIRKLSETSKNKEFAIIKSNFEMSLNLIKNEVKQLNKDLNSKISELKTIVNNQENYFKNRIFTGDNNDHENKSVFHMPIMIKNDTEKEQRNNQKSLLDNLDKMNDNTLIIKLLEIEERIINLENNSNKVKNKCQNMSLNIKPKNYNSSVNINKSADSNNQSFIIDDGYFANVSNINNHNQYQINNEENDFENANKNLIKRMLESTLAKNLITSKIREVFQKMKVSNEYNSAILNDITKHTDDINKIYESILNIRKTLAEKENDSQTDPIINNMIHLEENLNQHKISTEKKINEMEKMAKKIRDFIDESHKGLIELKFDDTGNSLKDFFKTILFNFRQNAEKTDKNNIRLDNLSVELLGKLKKDMQADSQKLFEDFREELKRRLIVIDDQIKAKVDIYNFDEYGKQLDKKISSEFSKKIDRNDLKKNNTIITKKIEHLQDKISKTLIDALTDIQLEEAPLIVKTGAMGNKCGSCNQVLFRDKAVDTSNNNVFSSPRTESRSKLLIPLSPIQTEKINFLKNIQEVSNNIGSYSKILSNLDEENINELAIDLRYRPNNLNNIINLPDVINKKANNLNTAQLKKHFRNKSTVINTSKLLKNNFSTNSSNTNNITGNQNFNDNKSHEYLKNFLDSELDTNFNLKGEQLLKAVDKFHDQSAK